MIDPVCFCGHLKSRHNAEGECLRLSDVDPTPTQCECPGYREAYSYDRRGLHVVAGPESVPQRRAK